MTRAMGLDKPAALLGTDVAEVPPEEVESLEVDKPVADFVVAVELDALVVVIVPLAALTDDRTDDKLGLAVMEAEADRLALL
jgi:hypothetical protein